MIWKGTNNDDNDTNIRIEGERTSTNTQNMNRLHRRRWTLLFIEIKCNSQTHRERAKQTHSLVVCPLCRSKIAKWKKKEYEMCAWKTKTTTTTMSHNQSNRSCCRILSSFSTFSPFGFYVWNFSFEFSFEMHGHGCCWCCCLEHFFLTLFCSFSSKNNNNKTTFSVIVRQHICAFRVF